VRNVRSSLKMGASSSFFRPIFRFFFCLFIGGVLENRLLKTASNPSAVVVLIYSNGAVVRVRKKLPGGGGWLEPPKRPLGGGV
jgi:hypothetical protein